MYQAYVIKDEKSGSYSTPIFVRALPDLLRSLIMGMKEGKAAYSQFPADFSLWRIGVWHEDTGVFESLLSNEWLLNFATLLDQSIINQGKEAQNGHA